MDLLRRNRELSARVCFLGDENRRKSGLLAHLSHELRNPLTSILGFAEIMCDERIGLDAPERSLYNERIVAGCRHLVDLVEDLLDVARIESGRLELHRGPVDVGALVEEVTGVLSGNAQAKGIALEIARDPRITVVESDPVRLKQILYNFISNAVKFTSDGGRVVVLVDRWGDDGFRLAVQDSGCGIRPEDLGRLFVEFGQFGPAPADGPRGAGLGLALSKSIAELLGGTVGVESTPGVGSLFFVVFPRC